MTRPLFSSSDRGFTLIEMLVVMLIISVLFGMSVATLQRLGTGPAMDVAEREVRAGLARVRTAAREQSALAEIIFEPGDPSVIRTRTTRDAGSWHFDVDGNDRGLGGRNNRAKIFGASLVEGGSVRRCLAFGGGDEVRCEPLYAYEPQRGFDLSMDVRPDDGGAGVVGSFGDVFTFEVGEDGELMASLLVEGNGEPISFETEKDVVAPEQWCRVRLTFDGIEARLFAHGVLEAVKSVVTEQQPGPRRLRQPERADRLKFGSKTWKGRIDEVIYRTVEEEESEQLANGEPVFFDHKGPVHVRFDSEGRLDPRVHEQEVVVKLKGEDGGARVVRIDMTGLMR